VSACLVPTLDELRTRWMTIAPTTVVISDAQIRKASLGFSAVFVVNSKIKFWFIRVLLHMNRLQPYINMWRLTRAYILSNFKRKYVITYL
jgi:hypothetical protein